jgi:hypothetical protein
MYDVSTVKFEQYKNIPIQHAVLWEKLRDLILATPYLHLHSVKAIRVYLEESLRIDFSVLQSMDHGY